MTYSRLFLIVLLTILFILTGCDPGKNPVTNDLAYNTCEGCHMHESSLKEFASEADHEEEPSGGG